MDRRTGALGIATLLGAAVVTPLLGSGLLGGGLDDALAARSRSRLRVVSVNVDGLGDVVLNQVVEVRFNARIAGASLKDGSISVVPFDVVNEIAGDARPFTLTKRGNTVRLVPVLPTHAVDLASGEFFAPGTPNDDAYENGSLRPATDYRLVIAGRSDKPAVRTTTRAKLKTTETFDFRTREDTSSEPLFEQEEYVVAPPPRALFTNPPDGVLSFEQGYERTTGTPEVPIDIDVTVFCNGVALDPATLREPGAVQLLKIAPLVDGEEPVPVAGDALVEQDRNRANITFRPELPLEENTTYALRIAETVTELSGAFAFAENAERRRLHDAYQWLAGSRRVNPSIPVEQLPDPPQTLVSDWPSFDQVARGELKVSLLAAGDATPSVVDPRVFAVFTTWRQPVTRTQEQSPAAVSSRRPGAGLAQLERLVAPLGLHGRAGVGRGGNVTLPFTLIDRRSRKGTVELEYGVDFDDDGIIDESEYRPLTVDRSDPQTTGADPRPRGKRGWSFVTAPDSGRSNAIVWVSAADLDRSCFRTLEVMYTPQGREIEDPNQPGTPVFAPAGTGVIVRMRSVRGRRRSSSWVYSDRFQLCNSVAPDLTIDDVAPGTSTSIGWSAIEQDSEDFNGNGVLDPLDGEDRNGNGVLEPAFVAVAFDYVVLGAGEDVDGLSTRELAALDWAPCTRDESAGDPDVDRLGAPTGIPHTFAWDHAADGLTGGERVVLRGRTFDETRLLSPWVYRTQPATIGD